MTPTPQMYARWADRMRRILDEIEEAHGEPTGGEYPHPTKMCLFMAWREAYQAGQARTSLYIETP